MAATTIAKTESTLTPTPYQLNIDQTLQASKVLLKHIQEESKRLQENSSKRNLLAISNDDDDEDGEHDPIETQPIWLSLTTKQHIVDKSRLKPSKVRVPHSLNTSTSLTICLITADPQRDVKEIIADPSFPRSLSSRITRIIGFTKLKERYRTFESRRQLLAEHDIFLADDRIITRLVDTLGKTFYKGTTKRPIPISIAKQERVDGKRPRADPKRKSTKEEGAKFASVDLIAKEIESAINCVPVTVKPGTNVAVRVGLSSFPPESLSENIKVVTEAVISRHVVKGWRNVKSIHIKSPTSSALPIWLADDMWVDDENILEEDLVQAKPQEAAESGITDKDKKRKRNPDSKTGPQAGVRKKAKPDTTAANRDAESVRQDVALDAARKAKLVQQKKAAFKTGVTRARLAAEANA